MFKTEGHNIFFFFGKFLCILAYSAIHSLNLYLNGTKNNKLFQSDFFFKATCSPNISKCYPVVWFPREKPIVSSFGKE